MNSGPCDPPNDPAKLESPEGGGPALELEANGDGPPLSEKERRQALKSNPLPSFAMHDD